MTQICVDKGTYLCHPSYAENDAVFTLTGDLCVAHERQAFLEGIHVGMRLFSELNELPGETQEIATSLRSSQ